MAGVSGRVWVSIFFFWLFAECRIGGTRQRIFFISSFHRAMQKTKKKKRNLCRVPGGGALGKEFFFKSSFERARQKTKKKETFAECQVAGHSVKTKKNFLNEPRARRAGKRLPSAKAPLCRVPPRHSAKIFF